MPTPAWRAPSAVSPLNVVTTLAPSPCLHSAEQARSTPALWHRLSAFGTCLVPSAPGALSALGILDADLRREFSRTVMLAPRSPQIAQIYRELESEARASFRDEAARPTLTRSADLRYQGQGFELRVDWAADAVSRFHRQHAQSYGYADPTRAVEIVTLRVQAIARTRKPTHRPAQSAAGTRSKLASPTTAYSSKAAGAAPRFTIAVCSIPAIASPVRPSSSNLVQPPGCRRVGPQP